MRANGAEDGTNLTSDALSVGARESTWGEGSQALDGQCDQRQLLLQAALPHASDAPDAEEASTETMVMNESTDAEGLRTEDGRKPVDSP